MVPMIRAPKHFVRRVEGEGDRNGAEADAELADKEPEMAAVEGKATLRSTNRSPCPGSKPMLTAPNSFPRLA
jgi:hypothetical protein